MIIHTARVQRLLREKLGWPVLRACDWLVSGAAGESGPVIACAPFNLRSLVGQGSMLGRLRAIRRFRCATTTGANAV